MWCFFFGSRAEECSGCCCCVVEERWMMSRFESVRRLNKSIEVEESGQGSFCIVPSQKKKDHGDSEILSTSRLRFS